MLFEDQSRGSFRYPQDIYWIKFAGGGRIAASFATTQPQGLRRLIIASGIADTKSYLEGLQIIRKQLSSDAQLAIDEGEQEEDFTSTRYMGAIAEFYGIYFLRKKPFPPKELLPGLKHMATDKTVKEAVWVHSVTIAIFFTRPSKIHLNSSPFVIHYPVTISYTTHAVSNFVLEQEKILWAARAPLKTGLAFPICTKLLCRPWCTTANLTHRMT